jgi:hypothetical protein
MKIGKNHYLSVIATAMIGCAVQPPPELVDAPEPPGAWKVTVEKKHGCPDTGGLYELTPSVAIFQKDYSWEMSIGNPYDYALLLPFERVAAIKRVPDETPFAFFRDSLLFESNPLGDTLVVTNPIKNSENFESHVFKQADQDYKCEAGSVVFPEFIIQGGSEGSTLSGRIHRKVTKTLGGDLLFYEQVRGFKTVHKYYLFKIKRRTDSAG